MCCRGLLLGHLCAIPELHHLSEASVLCVTLIPCVALNTSLSRFVHSCVCVRLPVSVCNMTVPLISMVHPRSGSGDPRPKHRSCIPIPIPLPEAESPFDPGPPLCLLLPGRTHEGAWTVSSVARRQESQENFSLPCGPHGYQTPYGLWQW